MYPTTIVHFNDEVQMIIHHLRTQRIHGSEHFLLSLVVSMPQLTCNRDPKVPGRLQKLQDTYLLYLLIHHLKLAQVQQQSFVNLITLPMDSKVLLCGTEVLKFNTDKVLLLKMLRRTSVTLSDQ
jgi:hypothetical protein